MMLTKRQAWTKLAREFSKVADGYYSRQGLCAGINTLVYRGSIDWYIRDEMQKQLRRIKSIERYWYSMGPKGAARRVEMALFLAEGMGDE